MKTTSGEFVGVLMEQFSWNQVNADDEAEVRRRIWTGAQDLLQPYEISDEEIDIPATEVGELMALITEKIRIARGEC